MSGGAIFVTVAGQGTAVNQGTVGLMEATAAAAAAGAVAVGIRTY